MWLRVLGSAAGGGFPQWNCGCPACRAVRDGSRPCRPRTQSSIAVSRRLPALVPVQRLARCPHPDRVLPRPASLPRPRRRRTAPLQAVLLTDAELDHTLGLLLLREGRALRAPRHRGGARDALRRDVAAADARAPTARSSGGRSCPAPTCRWPEGCPTGPSTCPPRSGPGSARGRPRPGRGLPADRRTQRPGRWCTCRGCRTLTPAVRARAGGLRLPADRRNLLAATTS